MIKKIIITVCISLIPCWCYGVYVCYDTVFVSHRHLLPGWATWPTFLFLLAFYIALLIFTVQLLFATLGDGSGPTARYARYVHRRARYYVVKARECPPIGFCIMFYAICFNSEYRRNLFRLGSPGDPA